MQISQQVDLQTHNSFGVPSRAANYCEPTNTEELRQALSYAREQSLSLTLLGGGSNILLAAAELPGLVVRLAIRGFEELPSTALQGLTAVPDRVYVRAEAGENWHEFVMGCLDRGWYGLENLALIPGNVGAAPIQNIGAYGVEQDEFCALVEVMDRDSGETRMLSAAQCEFAYRDSRFKRDWAQRYIILAVVYALRIEPFTNLSYQALRDELTGAADEESGTVEAISRELSDFMLASVTPEELAAAVIRIRRRKLPDPAEIPNAGSFFKNPVVSSEEYRSLILAHPDMPSYETAGEGEVKLSAAWLIDQLGWKGRRRGGAGVHEAHALVLVNPGAATGQELLELAAEIKAAVAQHFGIVLQQEVRVLPE